MVSPANTHRTYLVQNSLWGINAYRNHHLNQAHQNEMASSKHPYDPNLHEPDPSKYPRRSTPLPAILSEPSPTPPIPLLVHQLFELCNIAMSTVDSYFWQAAVVHSAEQLKDEADNENLKNIHETTRVMFYTSNVVEYLYTRTDPIATWIHPRPHREQQLLRSISNHCFVQ